MPAGRVHHQRRSAPRLDRLPDGSGAGQYRPARAGPAAVWPDWVLADKAYSSKAHRDYLAGRGIKAAIPIKDDQAAARRRKGPRGGRPPTFDRGRYRVRNTVERAINKLRNHRAKATRYEKRDFISRHHRRQEHLDLAQQPHPNPITKHAPVASTRRWSRETLRVGCSGPKLATYRDPLPIWDCQTAMVV